MKKISTLLLACATVATASAAGFSFNRQASIADVAKYNTQVKVENIELKANKVRPSFIKKNTVSRTSAGDIAGNWVGLHYAQGEGIYGINNFNIKGQGPKVTVSHFWNQEDSENLETYDVEATFENKDVKFEDGTFPCDVLTLPGKGQTIVGQYKGKNVSLYLVEIDGSSWTPYTNDLEFIYEEDDDLFWFPYDIGIGLVVDGEEEGKIGLLDYYEITEIDFANATLKGNSRVSDSETIPYSNAYLALDISENKTEDEFGCVGFAGCDGVPMYYMENGETIFFNQTAGTIYYNSTYNDIMICTTPDGENLTTEVVGELTEDGAKKISTFDNMIFFCPDIPANYMWLEDVVITNGENGAGISNVAADIDNSNAPVVYYNLQGQLVKEPAAGQIVIRKQGTEATKVLVK